MEVPLNRHFSVDRSKPSWIPLNHFLTQLRFSGIQNSNMILLSWSKTSPNSFRLLKSLNESNVI